MKKVLGVECSYSVCPYVEIVNCGTFRKYHINFIDSERGDSMFLPEALGKFRISALSSEDFSTVYGFHFEHDVNFYSLYQAGEMLSNLRKKMDKMTGEYGEIKTFGQFVNFIGLAIGAKHVYWYNSVTNPKDRYNKKVTDYARKSKIGEIVSDLDYSILSMTQDSLKPVNGISLS